MKKNHFLVILALAGLLLAMYADTRILGFFYAAMTPVVIFVVVYLVMFIKTYRAGVASS